LHDEFGSLVEEAVEPVVRHAVTEGESPALLRGEAVARASRSRGGKLVDVLRAERAGVLQGREGVRLVVARECEQASKA